MQGDTCVTNGLETRRRKNKRLSSTCSVHTTDELIVMLVEKVLLFALISAERVSNVSWQMNKIKLWRFCFWYTTVLACGHLSAIDTTRWNWKKNVETTRKWRISFGTRKKVTEKNNVVLRINLKSYDAVKICFQTRNLFFFFLRRKLGNVIGLSKTYIDCASS